MRHTLIALSLISLFSLSACQESQKEHDAKVAQQARERLLKELKAKEKAEQKQGKKNRLAQFGVQQTTDGKIIIDTNQTQSYFHKLKQKMALEIANMHRAFENGTLQEKEAGIEVNQSHIDVDLNKTKKFLDNLGKKMQGYVNDVETMVQEMNHTK